MEMNYCRRCGTELTEVAAHMYKCENGHKIFANSLPTVGVFLLNEANEVLVAIRDIEPGKGAYGIPGGFLNMAETLEEGLAREVKEEIGLASDLYESPQFLCSGIDLYDFGGESRTNVTSVFWTRIDSRHQPEPGDETSSIIWVSLTELNPDDFFFPAVQKGARHLKELLL